MRGFYSSNLYKKFPVGMQNAFVTFKGGCYCFARRGLTFGSYQKRVKRAERMSKEQLDAMQLGMVQDVVRHSYEQVPYYRKLFDRIGFKPADLQNIGDLARIPILEKDAIRHYSPDLLAADLRHKTLFKGTTSGTTGNSITLFMDRGVIKNEYAFADRQYRWAGVSSCCKTALLRGDLVVPTAQDKPPFWRYDAWNRQLWLSSYHLSGKNIEAYVAKLKKFKPELLFTYPSSLFSLCQLAKSRKVDLHIPGLKSIVTSSETLFDAQRKLAQESTGVKIYDWYGMFERVIFIGTCPCGSYHVFPDYGYTEFLPAGIDEHGEQVYELIGTGFINRAMPLIRYRTGDLVKFNPGEKCPCGCEFPVVRSICGRANDVIVTPSGRRLGMLEFAFDVENIICGQIIQQSLDRLEILVVPEPGFSEAGRLQVIRKLKERLDCSMKIDFRCVDQIPRTRTGKFKILVSKL